MALAFRVIASAFLAFLGVSATYLVADGRGILPWLLIFAVGLGIGFGTRGGWLAALVGVIAAHVLVGYGRSVYRGEVGRDAIDFAGDGLLLGIVLFTPGYLFGAAARRRPRAATGITKTDGEEVASVASASEPWLSRRAMIVLGSVILGTFALFMGFIVVMLLTTGGDRAP
jgi:hypothetical protein